MEKVKRKIDKCSPSLYVFLIEFAKPTPEEFNFDSFREHITKNFLLEEYQELIIELAKLHPTELEVLENYNLYSAINSLGYSSKPLKLPVFFKWTAYHLPALGLSVGTIYISNSVPKKS